MLLTELETVIQRKIHRVLKLHTLRRLTIGGSFPKNKYTSVYNPYLILIDGV